MAFLQQPIRYRRIVTPLMASPSMPELNSVEQRMRFILVAVAVLLVFLMGMLLQAFTASVTTQVQQVVAEQVESGGAAAAAAAGAGNSGGAAAAGPRTVTGRISAIFSPEVQYWADDIILWAAAHTLDPNMVATIMQIESCGDPQAISHAGARGLFQVMPFHFTAGEDMLDPDTNARRGMAYFAERLVQTQGDVGLAFAGYNGGHGAAGSSWDYWAAETQRYYVWSTGIYADAAAGVTESPALQRWLAAGGASLCQQASTRLGLTP